MNAEGRTSAFSVRSRGKALCVGTTEGSTHATGSLDRQAGAPVQAHQVGTEEARSERGRSRRDRGQNGEKGAGSAWRGEDQLPTLAHRHLAGPQRRAAIALRSRGSDARPAL